MPKIHLVTDDLLLGHTVSRLLMHKLGYEVFLGASLPEPALVSEAHLCIYESAGPGVPASRLAAVRQTALEIPLIGLFKYSHQPSINALLQAGAIDFLTLPSSLERLQVTIKNALTLFNMRKTLERLTHTHSLETPFPPLRITRTIELTDPNGKPKTLSHIEEEIIRLALTHHQGCLARTARELGIGRTTLYRKLRNSSTSPQHHNGAEPLAIGV